MKPESQVVMIKNNAASGQKSGIIRKNPGIVKAVNPVGRPTRPTGAIRMNPAGSKLQSGIVPRASVTGVTSGIRPKGSVTNVRVPLQVN